MASPLGVSIVRTGVHTLFSSASLPSAWHPHRAGVTAHPLPLTPDNFGGRIYRRTIIFRFFRPRTILPLLTRSWTRGASSSPPRFLLDRIGGGERERERIFFARLSVPARIKQGEGRGERSLSRVSHEARPRLMGTQFVAAAAYRRVYEAAALFRFYFGKNLAAYVTARIYARRAVGSASVRPSFVSPSLAFPSSLASLPSISPPISLLLLLLLLLYRPASFLTSTGGGCGED